MLLAKQSIDTPTCISAIFFQQTAHVSKLCDFRFIFGQAQSKIIELEPGKVLLSQIPKFSVTCKHKETRHIQGCTFCVIEVPSQCDVQAGQFYLPPMVNNCKHQQAENITQIYAVNLALLQHFFPQI